MLFSEVRADLFNSLFHGGGEVSLVNKKVVILEQVAQGLSSGVDVLDGLVGSILSDILTGELESVHVGGVEGDSIVSEVDFGESKLLEVSDKASNEMALGHLLS